MLEQLADGVLAEQAGQDCVAHSRIPQVVPAQMGDAGDEVALEQRQAGDICRDGQGDREQPADVGHEPLDTRQAHMGLDERADGVVDVTVRLRQPGVRGRGGTLDRADPVDRPLEHLAHVGRGELRCQVSPDR
ncbi:hypothetical protein BH18ACT8_BH18ACT8_05260 [soil metagenome]